MPDVPVEAVATILAVRADDRLRTLLADLDPVLRTALGNRAYRGAAGPGYALTGDTITFMFAGEVIGVVSISELIDGPGPVSAPGPARAPPPADDTATITQS
jgi:hypothetical protein